MLPGTMGSGLVIEKSVLRATHTHAASCLQCLHDHVQKLRPHVIQRISLPHNQLAQNVVEPKIFHPYDPTPWV